MSDTVELRHAGVENTIHVPEHRVERYKTRGWKPVAKKTSPDRSSEEQPGQGNDNKEE